MIVIGLDFGNYFTFPSFIEGLDEETRRGGFAHDLLSSDKGGIPSAYAPKSDGAYLGYAALSRPYTEVIRLLKSKMGADVSSAEVELLSEHKSIDVSIDAALTELAQYCVRQANQILLNDFGQTSNQVALAYPVTFDPLHVQKLINLVEAATLEDGRHVDVVGTVAEPAAAALDFLAEHEDIWAGNSTTILVYDLGAGTFDASLVTCYPEGRCDKYGNLAYYDVRDSEGIANIGGERFRELIMEMMGEQIGGLPVRGAVRAEIERASEQVKLELSEPDQDESCPFVMNLRTGEYYDIRIARSDFEEASKELLESTIDCVRTLLSRHGEAHPTQIVLTGGASQMPMVERELERVFGPNTPVGAQIVKWRPSKAISYGAARYYLPFIPQIPGPQPKKGVMIQRVHRDIGVRYIEHDTDRPKITTFIHRGTQLPDGDDANYSSRYVSSETRKEQMYSTYSVYIARDIDPNPYRIDSDWEYVGTLTIEYGRLVPKGTRSYTRVVIDRRGTLQVDAHMEDDNSVTAEVTLEYQGSGRSLLS